MAKKKRTVRTSAELKKDAREELVDELIDHGLGSFLYGFNEWGKEKPVIKRRKNGWESGIDIYRYRELKRTLWRGSEKGSSISNGNFALPL
jgi:hypothetical protein